MEPEPWKTVVASAIALGFVVRVVHDALARRSARKLERTLRESYAQPDDRECWACQHEGLTTLAPEVFCCEQCGNMQGGQAQEYRDAERRRAFAALPADRRHAKAADLLREVELQLTRIAREIQFMPALPIGSRLARRSSVFPEHEYADRRHAEETFVLFQDWLTIVRQVEVTLRDMSVLLEASIEVDTLYCSRNRSVRRAPSESGGVAVFRA